MKKLITGLLVALVYATGALAQIGGGVYGPPALPLSGGTITGNLVVTGSVTAASAAITGATTTATLAATTSVSLGSNTRLRTLSASGGNYTGDVTRFDDNSINYSNQYQNYGITGSAQGIGLSVSFGHGGVNDATAGLIDIRSAADWTSGANRSSEFVVQTITANSLGVAFRATAGLFTVTGSLTSADHAITSASATSLAVGRLGATTPAFTVDSSTGTQVAGLKVTGAVTGGTVAVVATDSGSDTNLIVNAKGVGTIGIGSVSTGRVTITPVTTITGALTLSAVGLVYNGVTLTGTTGTGKMVLDASATLSGTTTLAAATQTGNYFNTAGTVQFMCTTTNSSDVYTCAPGTALTAYTTGAMYIVKFNSANTTTTPTINISTLGAKTIVKRAATALAANDILANGFYHLVYQGANMQIINPAVPRRRPANDNRRPTVRAVVRRRLPMRRAA